MKQDDNYAVSARAKVDLTLIKAKAAAWDKLFAPQTGGEVLSEEGFALDTTIAVELAKGCKTFFRNSVAPMTYTERVSFGRGALTNWILNTLANVTYDSIEICFGTYTQSMADTHSTVQSNVGRITAFLWPYHNGVPAKDINGVEVDPFNLGDLKP